MKRMILDSATEQEASTPESTSNETTPATPQSARDRSGGMRRIIVILYLAIAGVASGMQAATAA